MGRLKKCFQLFQVVFIFIVLNLFVVFNSAAPGRTTPPPSSKLVDDINSTNRIPIGVVFDQNSYHIEETAFKFAMVYHTNNKSSDFVNFQVFVDVINTADVFKLSRIVCNQFSRGVIAIITAVQSDCFETFHSYANTFHVPFVTPFFPAKVLPPSSGMPDYALSILPDYHKAVLDTVTYYGWKNVIYLYDSHDGMLRLQQLFSSMMPGKKPYFRISNVKKIIDAMDVINYLKQLEISDRWSNKYVILDCTTNLAKEILINHVRDVTLGRRNYHYLLSGLVLDDPWDPEVKEYGTINMTGFKLVDTSRKFVRDFLNLWKVDTISAKGALMFDATHTLLEAYQRILKQKPRIMEDLMNKTNYQYRFLKCDAKTLNPLMFGEEITQFIRKIQLEGLTGNIRFSRGGVRKDFSLMVFRNSPNANMAKIATWYDDKGFRPVKTLNVSRAGKYDRNKTYVVTSIDEPPYFMSSRLKNINTDTEDPGEYSGFCADLALLIAEKLGIKIQFRLAADGKYGAVNPHVIGGWDGMVGELMRKEVDMVVAPLIVTEEREAVIDFSKPFLSFNRFNKKSDEDESYLLAFLRPLSKGAWYLLASSMVLVSVVMYVVSRFSPKEWRVVADPDSAQAVQISDATARQIIINEFSLWNSIWYAISSIMQQGSPFSPRSISGRIVSTFWWFFVLIIVCSYTAYLASQLTTKSIGSPQTPTYNRMAHCPEDMDRSNRDQIISEQEVYGDTEDTFIPHPIDFEKAVKSCEMVVSIADSGIKDFAVGFPKGSKIRDVNHALTTIREEGELKRLLRKHFHKTSCEVTKLTGGGTELTLKEVAGLFYLLLLGISLGIVAAAYEFCKNHRSDGARPEAPIKSAIESNTRQQVREIKETRNTTRRRRRNQERSNGGGNAPGSYAGPLEEIQEVTSQYSPIFHGRPVRITPPANQRNFQNSRPRTPRRAIAEQPLTPVAPGNLRSNLNAPFICSSPRLPSNQNMRCVGPRQGTIRKRPCPVLDEADTVQTYFTPANPNGPEEAALRNSFSQV